MVATVTNVLTDFGIELGQAEKDILGFETVSLADLEKRTRLVFRLFHRASLTGDFEHFRITENAIDSAVAQFGPKEDLCLLKANLDFRFHRLAEVKRDLEMAPGLASRAEARSLVADLDFQHGRYAESKHAYEELIARNRTWDNLARLAYFQGKMGGVDSADRLYVEAEDELTAKEMRSYAWLELQRGVLDLTRGRHRDAEAHYDRAGRAYSGHWMVDEHKAELLAARGRFEEALELYLDVAARVKKPELEQAIGELYAFMGRREEAEPWYDRALDAYLDSAERGEVHYYHHLADFYTDAREAPAEAVKWARKDVAMRPNYATQAALAWALWRNGEKTEAVRYMQAALSSGVQDAHLFATAASVLASEEYRHKALEINPHHQCFHVHH